MNSASTCSSGGNILPFLTQEVEPADGRLPEVQAALPPYTGAHGLNEAKQVHCILFHSLF